MQTSNRYRDPLTGVHTRASLIDALQNEVARARRYGEPFSILMLDLDYFKNVNDAFGHLRGDQVLVQFTLRMKAMHRGSDLIYRYGGDEFVLLLPKTEKGQAGVVARRLLDETLARPFAGDPPVSLALSIGVASFPDDAQTSATLLEIADQRHYLAKRNGRCQVVDNDLRKRTAPILNPPDRMVERDQQLSALNDFFRDLTKEGRGVFLVTGPAGSGKSRFLAEAGRVARLQRLVVFDLAGKAAMAHRRFGALIEAQWPWNFKPALLTDVPGFASLLAEWMAHKGDSGLVIVVDDMEELDAATSQFLQELLTLEMPFQIGILLSTGQNGQRGNEPVALLKSEIELTPLSYEGTRVWLRQSLHWEPPPAFLRWIFTKARGLPGEISKTLVHMIESGSLTRTGRDWEYRDDLEQLPVKDRLRGERIPSQVMLPVDTPDFIGRVDELRQIREKMRLTRLVTICGPAGAGKTRLALQAAMEVDEQFPSGMLFQALVPGNAPVAFAAELASTLGARSDAKASWQDAVSEAVGQRQMLLVLDDVGVAAWQVDLVRILLDSNTRLHILATGMDTLGIDTEQVVQIKGMQYPPYDDEGEGSTGYDAVQLFLNSVRKNAPTASITTADIRYVAKIVRLLRGLPLGIELAAAWVPAFYPHEIAAELERWLQQTGKLAARSDQSGDDLGEIIETFWFMLSEPEQAVLSRLSVFRGDFTSQAARQIAGASPFFVDAVAAKAFILRTTQGTYIFRERLRQMIFERLNWNIQEMNLIQEVHARYYLNLVGRWQEIIHPNAQSGGEDLSRATQNIRSAWQWAIEAQALDLVRAVTGTLCAYYHYQGRGAEAQQVCQQAIALIKDASDDGDQQQVLDELETCARQIG